MFASQSPGQVELNGTSENKPILLEQAVANIFDLFLSVIYAKYMKKILFVEFGMLIIMAQDGPLLQLTKRYFWTFSSLANSIKVTLSFNMFYTTLNSLSITFTLPI